MKTLFKKFLASIAVIFMAGSWVVAPLTATAAARDCDSNAVLYCGAYSTSELARKINQGTGKPHQTARELKALYGRYHIYTRDFGKLKNGRVTRDNKVIVGNKVVARNVYSMGRHYMPGSRRISGLSYPLYLRHPSVSFRSSSIDAFIYLNYDGTMRYAVIKSCGNIVPGVVRNRPAPAPVTYSLEVRKFHDHNGNGSRDTGDEYLAGWQFRITGPNSYDRTVTTGTTGTVRITGLGRGTYVVTELPRTGWVVTNGATRRVYLDRNRVAMFGNMRPTTPPPPVTPPETPEVPTSLPSSGPAEAAAAAVASMTLAGGTLSYIRSKKQLLSALKNK